MKRKRYTAEQMISILEEHQVGASVADLFSRQSIVENTIYRWKSKYCGREISKEALIYSMVRSKYIHSMQANRRIAECGNGRSLTKASRNSAN